MSRTRAARLIVAAVTAALAATLAAPAAAAPTPRGAPVAIACTGPAVTEGRAVAKANQLQLGLDPKACFGRMQIYDGPNHQIVVSAPASRCPGGKAIDVYDQSRAGGWYSDFKEPVCGAAVSIGPKNQWGDWMLTIDGKHYDSRGQFYVPVN